MCFISYSEEMRADWIVKTDRNMVKNRLRVKRIKRVFSEENDEMNIGEGDGMQTQCTLGMEYSSARYKTI